jgi:hypothetical protein
VLYLADKMTLRDRYVSVEERFEARLKALDAKPELLDAVAVRRENALLIRHRIEARIGSSLREVMKENGLR